MEEKKIPVTLDKFKFIKLRKEMKAPLEKWREENNQYNFDSIELNKHIELGYNYGVVTGNELIVIDVDDISILEEIEIPETFTINTPKGYHFYFKSNLNTKLILKRENGEHVGEIQANGQYVVAPNSVNEDGIKYRVVKDIAIEYLDMNQVFNIFSKYLTNYFQTITIPNTITTTNTIIHPESDSELNSEYINIFEDERFEKGDYSIKVGISFIKINDMSKFKITNYTINGEVREKYSTEGSLYRSPQGFTGEEIRIDFVKGGINAIKDKVKPKSKNVFLIIFRASERLYAVENTTKEIFDKLLEKEDGEIIELLPEFKERSKSKLTNLKRNKSLKDIVERLSNGIKDYSIQDSFMGEIIKEAIKMKLSDEEIHKIHKTHYEDRYDFSETQLQIDYTNRLLEVKE